MSEKVLLILVDGMRPDGLLTCGNDRMEAYFKEGSYSFKCQTVWPSITLPCHLSLFRGVSPAVHGTMDNIYKPGTDRTKGLMETLTDHDKSCSMFYIWEELRDIVRPGYLSYSWFMAWERNKWMNLDERATKACEAYIKEAAPDFAFLYLGETDEYGHTYGWMSEEYLDCIRRASDCIEEITAMLPEEYSVIVTADHGGHDYEHGLDIPEDMTIPITFRGKHFEAGKELENVSILDIAPTVAALLGIEPEKDWEGKSVFR